MKSIKLFGLLLMTIFITCISCDKDEDKTMTSKDINLNLSSLTNLGNDYVYEGWIIVDGSPISTGTFTVNDAGTLSATAFSMNAADLDKASKFVLSIEPTIDNDPAPSATKYLAGDFSGSSASVSISPIGDFNSASGDYILATPTNGGNSDENSGIWWVDPTGAAPTNSLTLPTLPAGWKYEGWVVIEGQPVSTGTFTNVSATDDSAPHSGMMSLPAPNGADGFFPGEDFLVNAPTGLTFPTDIRGGTAVVSIEPSPDNNSMPFTLKPLVGAIPMDAADHTLYSMGQNLNFPSGTVNR